MDFGEIESGLKGKLLRVIGRRVPFKNNLALLAVDSEIANETARTPLDLAFDAFSKV
jgi:hypothetical protein